MSRYSGMTVPELRRALVFAQKYRKGEVETAIEAELARRVGGAGPTIQRGTVLLDRRKRGLLVQVRYVTGTQAVRVISIDAAGWAKTRARLRLVPKAEVEARFLVYRPCRWVLDCLAQATVTVGHSSGDIDACAGHAAEYEKWLEAIKGIPHVGNWPDEPEPECLCPDDVGTVHRMPVRYCPKDGTPERRGTELGDVVPVSGGAGPVLEGPDRGKFLTGGPYFDE